MRFINCSTVICSPTVILMLSWEKPLVKPMAPGSISYHICFQSTFICIFTFCIYIIKYQKYIYLIILSLLDLTFASGHEGIDNPFIALVASFQFVCVGAWDFWGASYWIDTLVLKNWGKYLRYSAASSLPLRGKPTQAQDVAPTSETLMATYARLKAEFEEIVAVEKQYSPGKVMAPIEDEDMARRDEIPRWAAQGKK